MLEGYTSEYISIDLTAEITRALPVTTIPSQGNFSEGPAKRRASHAPIVSAVPADRPELPWPNKMSYRRLVNTTKEAAIEILSARCSVWPLIGRASPYVQELDLHSVAPTNRANINHERASHWISSRGQETLPLGCAIDFQRCESGSVCKGSLAGVPRGHSGLS
ncbi:hypothetical protein KM043_017120 [Ampulex compressa]|nr:hypothetical protein KM043_017120 [Ampulex compressa]